jgi:hypothetical protein
VESTFKKRYFNHFCLGKPLKKKTSDDIIEAVSYTQFASPMSHGFRDRLPFTWSYTASDFFFLLVKRSGENSGLMHLLWMQEKRGEK